LIKSQLEERVVELAHQLDIDTPNTEGMTNPGLEGLIDSLESQLPPVVEDPPATQTPAPPVVEDPPATQTPAPPVSKTGFVVAQGRSVCCGKRGVVGPGEEIGEDDFGNGAEGVADFVKRKIIVKA